MITPKITSLSPRSKSLPIWLKFLFTLNRVSTICVFSLITITLTVYSASVDIPKVWNQQYKKLLTLQKNEQAIIANNEILKQQIAQQAEKPNSGLVKANPNHAIFLKPAPNSALKNDPKLPISEPEKFHHSKSTTPLAY